MDLKEMQQKLFKEFIHCEGLQPKKGLALVVKYVSIDKNKEIYILGERL